MIFAKGIVGNLWSQCTNPISYKLSTICAKNITFKRYESKSSDKPSKNPLLFLHGLFGNKLNFDRQAKWIIDDLNINCYSLDSRNHGNSPWADSMSYEEMADDIKKFIALHSLKKVNVLGHSMGGKTAILLCCHYPELIQSAVIVDMFPVKFDANIMDLVCIALNMLNLNTLKSRKEAFVMLEPDIPSVAERNFILSNLVQGKDHRWKWRCNLSTISESVTEIRSIPSELPNSGTKSLFLYGGNSDYANQSRIEITRKLFLNSKFERVPNAGHIVHLDQPELFYQATKKFFSING